MTDTQAPDVVVTEADREAAKNLLLGPLVGGGDGCTYALRTPSISEASIAFARHRLSTQSAMEARIEELEADLSGLLKWADNVCRARGIATGQLAVERARATLSNISEKP